jgi:Domain of unknown function (DUF4424)
MFGMRYGRILIAVASMLAPVSGFFCRPVLANDSSAELSVGGLVFKKNSDVSIESEDLRIGIDNVIVRYRFRNQSRAPVTLTIAFPLPDIDLSEAENTAIPTSDPNNFVGFRTKIDGKPATFEIVQQAFVGKTDVSAKIKEAGLMLLPIGGEQLQRIRSLPESTRARLLDAGLLMPAGSDEQGHELYGSSWVVKTSFLREQVFPAGQSVEVEHRYRTSVGVSFDTVMRKSLRESKAMQAEFERYRRDYCVTDDLLRAIDKIAGGGEANAAHLQERRISYVLSTGANWAGPIRDFHLVVDKGEADRLVSFCSENVKKISPTVFEVRAKNFTPGRDLNILLVGKR